MMTSFGGRLKIVRTPPTARAYWQAIIQFAKAGPGVVTADVDGNVRMLHSLFRESDLAEHLEFLVFGQWSSKCCRFADLESLPLCTAGHQLAALQHACSQLHADNPLYPAAVHSGFLPHLADTLSMLHHWQIGVDEMRAVSFTVPLHEGGKLSSLAVLDSVVHSILKTLGRESQYQRLNRLIDHDPAGVESLGRLLIHVTEKLTPLEAKWIEWMANAGAEVSLLVDEHPGSDTYFDGPLRFFSHLISDADIQSVGESNELFRAMFSNQTASEGVRAEFVTAADRLAECEWALRACLDAEQRGESIVLYVRDLQGYIPLLLAAASRLEVPLTASWRAPLLTNRFAAFLSQLLSALASKDVRALVPAIRTPYLGLNPLEVEQFEEVLKAAYREGPRAWMALDQWAQGEQDLAPWLAPLLDWRLEGVDTPATRSEWFARIRDLAEILPWQDLPLCNDSLLQRDLRAQTVMLSTLADRASIANAVGNELLSLNDMVDWALQTWGNADCSIPANVAGIRVVSQACLLGVCDTVFAIGMTEAEFPSRRHESPVLSDAERRSLATALRLEVPLPTSERHAQNEREEFLRVVAAPSQRLVLSCRQLTGDRDTFPSSYVDEVDRAVGGIHRTVRSQSTLVPPLEECTAEADKRFLLASHQIGELVESNEWKGVDAAEWLRWSDDHPFSLRELRSAMTCPFQFQARFGLKLSQHRPHLVWSRLTSLPDEAELASCPTPTAARHRMNELLELQLEAMHGRYPEATVALLRLGGRKYIDDLVTREFKAREKWPRDLDTVQHHVKFGSSEIRNQVGSIARIQGEIPAISKSGAVRNLHYYDLVELKNKDDAEFPPGRVIYALAGMLAQGYPNKVALEIDSKTGKRFVSSFVRLGNIPLTEDANFGFTLLFSPTSNALHDNPLKRIEGEIVRMVEGAAEVARSGTISTKPTKSNCSGCDLAEICRQSFFFGENPALFGATTPTLSDSEPHVAG